MPQLPPSRIAATLPCISSQTSWALVGLGLPLILAEGAATGQPQALINCCANLLLGKRTATVGKPALTASGTISDLLITKVKGPGQKACINALAFSFKPVVKGSTSLTSAMCKIKGLSLGLPLAAKIFATASLFKPLAPKPYTVSVGKATTSPAWIKAAALTITSWSCSLFCNFQ